MANKQNNTIVSPLSHLSDGIQSMQQGIMSALLNMRVSDFLALNGSQMSLPESTVKSVKSAVKRRRRRSGVKASSNTPMQPRIEAFIKGADDQWRTIADIAERAGVPIPSTTMRDGMVDGYKSRGKTFRPVLKSNGKHARACRYRLISRGKTAQQADKAAK